MYTVLRDVSLMSGVCFAARSDFDLCGSDQEQADFRRLADKEILRLQAEKANMAKKLEHALKVVEQHCDMRQRLLEKKVSSLCSRNDNLQTRRCFSEFRAFVAQQAALREQCRDIILKIVDDVDRSARLWKKEQREEQEKAQDQVCARIEEAIAKAAQRVSSAQDILQKLMARPNKDDKSDMSIRKREALLDNIARDFRMLEMLNSLLPESGREDCGKSARGHGSLDYFGAMAALEEYEQYNDEVDVGDLAEWSDQHSEAEGCELGRVDSVQGLEVRPTTDSETGLVDALNADISAREMPCSRLDRTATRLRGRGNGPYEALEKVLRGEEEAAGARIGGERDPAPTRTRARKREGGGKGRKEKQERNGNGGAKSRRAVKHVCMHNSGTIGDSQLPLATCFRCGACARKEDLSYTKAQKQTHKQTTNRKDAPVPDEAETNSKVLQDVREDKVIHGERAKTPAFRRPTLPAPGPAKPHIIKRPQWLEDLNAQHQTKIVEQEERERVRKEFEHKREASFLRRWARVLPNANAQESAFLSPRIHAQDRADDGEDEVMWAHPRKVWGLQRMRLEDLRSTRAALPLEGTFLARLTEDTSSGRRGIEVGELQPCRALEARSRQGSRKLEHVLRFNIGAPEYPTCRMKILKGIYDKHLSQL